MTSHPTNAASSDAVNATRAMVTNAGDSCTWYAGETCSLPRTGFDCLNVLLETDECAIAPNGACVSISVYEKYLSNREHYEPLSRYFPAYTYCSADDSVCSTCIAEWSSNYEMTGSGGSTKYCTGSDGCICIAATEVPDWEQTVVANQCDGSSDSSSSGPQLRLTGWKSLREKLIETEHSFVQVETRLDATVRSEESLSEAPSVVVDVCPAPPRSPAVESQYMMAPM
ncbi:hypothetical protein GN958_ATG02181 [Phytophthora infestans]|uniref:Uncharacterized protein n=1 Tax=Phytophthora infestans TaxID=4787 RepID=A0A8S9V554_PHYIN|nr:hypothetical protein GN958_ATG02181 [Phytophthora infestans]